MKNKPELLNIFLSFFILFILFGQASHAQSKKNTTQKPNILVIMTDDVGLWNVGA